MADDVFGIVGTVVAGAYQVEAVVAEGGFGVVYRAHHSGFRAPVALKCLKVPQQLSQDQEEMFLEQFRAEAELLFRLSASIPTVVRPLHVDAITLPDGRFVPFMALEWLEGETLDAIAQRRKAEGLPPLPLKKLVRMLTPVARALERAHNFMGPNGPISVVHRDMKPENIFVASVAGEEVVKILDFGIGKAKSVASQVAGRASQTEASFSSFTPAYGAPEQWVPKRFGQTGPWTDVWGLALTLVEVMAGRTIIDGDHAGMMGTALDPDRRPSPRNEGLEVADGVEAVFLRALAVDPRERYADAGEFWNDLVAALGMRGEARDGGGARDPRAEGADIPRSEQVEAALSSRGSAGPRQRIATGASRGGQLPAEAAAAAGLYPELAAVEPGPSAPAGPPLSVPDLALGDIPDLAAPGAKAQSGPPKAEPAYARELDFEDGGQAASLALDVDLAPGERPSLRVPPVGGSRPDWPAVGSRPDWPVPDPGTEPRRRVSSAAVPVVPASAPPAAAVGAARTASGQYPVTAATSGAPPARGTSGAGWAAAQPGGNGAPAAPSGSIRPPPGSSVPMPSYRPAPPAGPGWSQGPGPLPIGPGAAPASLGRRLAPGLVLVSLSIIVTIADQIHAASSGEVWSLGPVRAGWIAGPFLLVGVVLIALRLIPKEG